jgi:hypothetical protein
MKMVVARLVLNPEMMADTLEAGRWSHKTIALVARETASLRTVAERRIESIRAERDALLLPMNGCLSIEESSAPWADMSIIAYWTEAEYE